MRKTASEQIRSLESRIDRLEKEASRRRGWGRLLYKIKKREEAKVFLDELLFKGVITQKEHDESMRNWLKKKNNALSEYLENRPMSYDQNNVRQMFTGPEPVYGEHSSPPYPEENLKANRFVGEEFDQTKFQSMRFKETIFLSCTFKDCQFIGVHYSKGSLKDSIFSKCLFKNTTFWHTDFSGVILIGTRFENCDFSKGKLYKIGAQEALTDKQVRNILDQKLTVTDRRHFEKLLLSKI
jgi:hypothetical protein